MFKQFVIVYACLALVITGFLWFASSSETIITWYNNQPVSEDQAAWIGNAR